jgi:hypothetical protein
MIRINPFKLMPPIQMVCKGCGLWIGIPDYEVKMFFDYIKSIK